MRKPRDYKPIEFRQLCMVVKMILQQAPEIDDAEWKARTRDHLQRLGFDEPASDILSRAMTQVEQALKSTIGQRLTIPAPAPETPIAPPAPEPTGRTHNPAGWDIVTRMMGSLRKVSPVLESTSPRPVAREILGLTEVDALNEFWRQVREGGDKLVLLRAFAEVALVRPAGWDYQEVRSAFQRLRFGQEGCFVCYFSETQRHHIIQIQHGGSNYVRNFVPICSRCHEEIHPWLAKPKTRVSGWTQLNEIEAAYPSEGKKLA
jgi:hypothetical protein